VAAVAVARAHLVDQKDLQFLVIARAAVAMAIFTFHLPYIHL